MTLANIPVFLNGCPAGVSPGNTLRDLIAQEAPDVLAAFDAGTARATDARGIEVPGDQVLSAGAIFRVAVSARTARPDDA